MIISVPIDTSYEIENAATKFDNHYTLPMIKECPESIELFENIVKKRIETEIFFDEAAFK